MCLEAESCLYSSGSQPGGRAPPGGALEISGGARALGCKTHVGGSVANLADLSLNLASSQTPPRDLISEKLLETNLATFSGVLGTNQSSVSQ